MILVVPAYLQHTCMSVWSVAELCEVGGPSPSTEAVVPYYTRRPTTAGSTKRVEQGATIKPVYQASPSLAGQHHLAVALQEGDVRSRMCSRVATFYGYIKVMRYSSMCVHSMVCVCVCVCAQSGRTVLRAYGCSCCRTNHLEMMRTEALSLFCKYTMHAWPFTDACRVPLWSKKPK